MSLRIGDLQTFMNFTISLDRSKLVDINATHDSLSNLTYWVRRGNLEAVKTSIMQGNKFNLGLSELGLGHGGFL
jgi:hypothetical protein